MRKAEWYVVQVQTGREDKACEAIRRLGRSAAERGAGEVLLEECFSPTYAYRRKEHGEWVPREARLLPGYVVAVTPEPWELSRALYATTEFARLVKMGETFVPLSADDRSWIERWTKEGDRTIPMSLARKEGDTIVVTEGPLLGREGMVTRVNRRRRVAHVEIQVGQITVHTTVGLEVVPEA